LKSLPPKKVNKTRDNKAAKIAGLSGVHQNIIISSPNSRNNSNNNSDDDNK
jgi:hypothetical protein